MKKLATALLSTVLAVSTLSMGLVANAASLSDVGTIGEKGLPDRFKGMEAQVTQKYKEAFQWATKLHALDSEDLFDFGNASGEFVHRWSGTDLEENVYEICNQDFDGGNSTASAAFSYTNWAAILCANETTLNVVIMRDAPAEYYAQGGGVNNLEFGDPTTNQYWRVEDGVEVLYQQFTNGYLRSEEGKSYFTEFHNYIAEGADYVEPPAAPPAYGDIYAINEDGCTWEQPRFVPNHPDITHNDDGTVSIDQGHHEGDTNNPGGINTDPTISDPDWDPNQPGTEDPTNSTATSTTASGASSTVSGTTVSGNTVSGNTVSGSTVSGDNNQTASGTSGGTTTVRKMNVGATVGIVVACVVVVGGGAFCLYWFVLRKKKAAADGVDADAADDAAKTEEKSDDKPEDKK